MKTSETIRLPSFRRVAPRTVILTVALATIGLLIGSLRDWPLWALVTTVLLPAVPLLAFETVRTYRQAAWLSLFFVVVFTQAGHVLEHVAQMIQLHLLGKTGLEARGAFGALDIEWVHFIWNGWVLVALSLLAWRFRSNTWLWVSLGIAMWHMAEHAFIMTKFLPSGMAGHPGLLGRGGALGGGSFLSRPDLHFLYNLIETTPLLVAFAVELKRDQASRGVSSGPVRPRTSA